jgi:hypothetical protein
MLFAFGSFDSDLGQSLADQSIDAFRRGSRYHDGGTSGSGTILCGGPIRHGATAVRLQRNQPPREHVGEPNCAGNILVRFPVQPDRVVDRRNAVGGSCLGPQAGSQRLAGLFYLALSDRAEDSQRITRHANR